jgi:secreted Zn-dependent insulinase-like peptidase
MDLNRIYMNLQKQLIKKLAIFTFLIITIPCKAIEQERLEFQLPNGIKAIAISDPSSQLAALSVTINTGQRDAPIELEGLPHLLEHAVFYGSKDFPNPSGFREFIKKSSGWSNGSTRSDNTRYHLQVNFQQLEEASTRLQDLIYNPILDIDSIKASVSEVDEEFKSTRNKAWINLLSVIRENVNPEHPSSLFGIGNKESFGDNNRALQKQLRHFHSSFYFSRKTTIAVYGPQSVEELKTTLIRSFGKLKSFNSPTDDKSSPLTLKDGKGVIIEVPINTGPPTLDIRIEVPPQNSMESYELFTYIRYLISNKSEGSLFSKLNKKELISDLRIYTQGNSNFEVFDLYLEMTTKGAESLDEILATIESYFNFLKSNQHPSYLLSDNRTINELITSKSSASIEPGDWMSDLSDKMQLERFYKKDEAQSLNVDKYLTFFSLDLTQIYLSRKSDSIFKTKTKYYNAPYRKLDTVRLLQANPDKSEAYQFPKKNIFLNHEIKSALNEKRIITDKKEYCLANELYVIPQESNNTVVSTVDVVLPNYSIKNRAMSELVVEYLTNYLNESLYEAAVAGYSFKIIPKNDGLRIQIEGDRYRFNYFHSEITNALFKLNEFMPRDNLESAKNNIKAIYQKQDYKQVYRAVRNSGYSSVKVESLLEELNKISAKDISTYLNAIRDKTILISSVTGDFGENELKYLLKDIKKTVGKSCNLKVDKTFKLQRQKSNDLYRYSAKGDAVSLGLFIKDGSYKDLATIFVLKDLFKQPFHDLHRRQQKIAYIASVDVNRVNHHALVFTIQSSTLSSDILLDKIQKFLLMPENYSDFEDTRKRVVNGESHLPVSLLNRGTVYNELIRQGFDPIKYTERIKRELHKLSVEDIKEFINNRRINEMTQVFVGL